MPPTSQDLVANNQPYGNRQQNVAAMQQAGLPTSSSQVAPAPGGAAPRPAGSQPQGLGGPRPPMTGLDLLAQRRPEDFPFINSQPSQAATAQAPDSVLTALGASAQSSFAKAVLARLNSR